MHENYVRCSKGPSSQSGNSLQFQSDWLSRAFVNIQSQSELNQRPIFYRYPALWLRRHRFDSQHLQTHSNPLLPLWLLQPILIDNLTCTYQCPVFRHLKHLSLGEGPLLRSPPPFPCSPRFPPRGAVSKEIWLDKLRTKLSNSKPLLTCKFHIDSLSWEAHSVHLFHSLLSLTPVLIFYEGVAALERKVSDSAELLEFVLEVVWRDAASKLTNVDCCAYLTDHMSLLFN